MILRDNRRRSPVEVFDADVPVIDDAYLKERFNIDDLRLYDGNEGFELMKHGSMRPVVVY